MKKNYLLVFLIFILVSGRVFAAENINVNEETSGKRTVMTYDLNGEKLEIEVHLTVKAGGKIYQAKDIRIEDGASESVQEPVNRITLNVEQNVPSGPEIKSEEKEEPQTGPKTYTEPNTGMPFNLVEGGCFLMGDMFGDGEQDEKPVHEVCLGNFYMGQYEVTQGEWIKIMGNNPSGFAVFGPKCPVDSVSWSDVQVFVGRLNKISGKNYRLPTEAEWEYAAQSGGKSQRWSGTNSKSSLEHYAWYAANAEGKTHPVGQKQPNGLGLYDMTGNVWEWCGDVYEEAYYKKSSKDNPTGPGSGSKLVLRGGAWYSKPASIRSTNRLGKDRHIRELYNGFRLVLPVE